MKEETRGDSDETSNLAVKYFLLPSSLSFSRGSFRSMLAPVLIHRVLTLDSRVFFFFFLPFRF